MSPAVDRIVEALVERPEVVERMGRWLDESQVDVAEHEVVVLDRPFVVLPGVFSPGFYPETEFYGRAVLDAVGPGVRFLDLGCGIGVNAVLAAEAGADVVALDVNPAAVDNTRRNAERHGVVVDVRCSDIFSALADDERFDIVYWNIPFAFRRPDVVLTTLEEAVFDPGYRKNTTFLGTVGERLAPGGVVLIGVSSTLGELGVIEAAAAEGGLVLEQVASTLEEGTEPPTWLELLAGRCGASP